MEHNHIAHEVYKEPEYILIDAAQPTKATVKAILDYVNEG